MKRNILDGCRDRGIVQCQVGPQNTLYWQKQPQESRDAGGAVVWEEVLAATPGQQKQMKMKYLLFLKIRFIFLGTALHPSQNRSEFSHRSRKPQKALLSVSYHITSSCQAVSYLHTCAQPYSRSGGGHTAVAQGKNSLARHILCVRQVASSSTSPEIGQAT